MKYLFQHCISMVSLLFILIHSGKDQCGSGRLLLCPLCVCVCVLVCSTLVCSTCVWHYNDKAAQPLRGDGECQRLEWRSEQLPNIWVEWETQSLHGWPATPQRGSRAKGGGQVKPQMCVWNITLSLLRSFDSLLMHISSQTPKNNAHMHTHTQAISSLFCTHLHYQVSFMSMGKEQVKWSLSVVFMTEHL